MAKGSQFERDFSVALSKWWSDGRADDWFWRSSQSGGRATVRGKSGKSTANSAGDICAQTAEASRLLSLITFELKRGYPLATIDSLVQRGSDSELAGFFQQARKSASLAGTPIWALVHKRDYRKAVVYTNLMRGTFPPQSGSVYIPFFDAHVITLDKFLTRRMAEEISACIKNP